MKVLIDNTAITGRHREAFTAPQLKWYLQIVKKNYHLLTIFELLKFFDKNKIFFPNMKFVKNQYIDAMRGVRGSKVLER